MEKPTPTFSIESLKESLGIEEPDPAGKTIPDWAELLGIGKEEFRSLVKKAVKNGKWLKCSVLKKGHRYPGYKPVEVSDE